MKTKGNDCYTCPYREQAHGSDHSMCKYPSELPPVVLAVVLHQRPTLLEPHITINPTGIRGGWATWPINFDPVWITCNLKIDEQ